MSANDLATPPPKDLSDLHTRIGAANLLQAIAQNEQPWQLAPAMPPVTAPSPTSDPGPHSSESGQAIRGETVVPRRGPDARSSDSAMLPPINDATDFVAVDWNKPPELISGMLHAGSKCSVGGPSKANKTWLLTDMGVSVATGSTWLGQETTQSSVLYVNFEVQAPFFADRVRQVCDAKGVILEPGQLGIWNLRGYAADWDSIAEEMASQVEAGGYRLLILDPTYKLMGGRDENSSRDIGNLLNGLERLTVQTGAAVAFATHFAKGNASGKDSIDRVSGSGVFARDPDTILTVTPHEEPECFTVEATLRNFAPVPPFVVRRQHPLMVRVDDLDPAKLRPRPRTHRFGTPGTTKTAADLLALVPAEGTLPKKALISLAQANGIGDNKAAGFVSELLHSEHLVRTLVPRAGTRPEVYVGRPPSNEVGTVNTASCP